MSESRATTHITSNHREIAIKAFSLDKARDVSGSLIQIVLDGTGATVEDISRIEETERQMERRISGLLKLSLMEFTEMWTGDLERRLDAMVRLQEDAANCRLAKREAGDV